MDRLSLPLGLAASLALVVMVTALPSTKSTRPPYIDCVNSNECGTFECCVIGMGRFSIPTCRLMQEEGQICSPVAAPARTNLSYPDGSFVSLTNVYFNICPCSYGLSCSGKTGKCMPDTVEMGDYNFLMD